MSAGSLSYAKETLEPIWDEVMGLAHAHWRETEAYRHGQQFNPDKRRYLHNNELGYYRMYTARQAERLVGYAGMYLMPSMHTQQLIAHEDTYFLLPDARRGRHAIAFYNFIEDELVAEGVVEIHMTHKLSNGNGVDRILTYLGYEHVEAGYSKQFPKNLDVPDNRTVRAA